MDYVFNISCCKDYLKKKYPHDLLTPLGEKKKSRNRYVDPREFKQKEEDDNNTGATEVDGIGDDDILMIEDDNEDEDLLELVEEGDPVDLLTRAMEVLMEEDDEDYAEVTEEVSNNNNDDGNANANDNNTNEIIETLGAAVIEDPPEKVVPNLPQIPDEADPNFPQEDDRYFRGENTVGRTSIH